MKVDRRSFFSSLFAAPIAAKALQSDALWQSKALESLPVPVLKVPAKEPQHYPVMSPCFTMCFSMGDTIPGKWIVPEKDVWK